tara:strand:+ start:143 stop:478 length:336 start_codon:yes stop_codon:yes gene_type:complete
MKNTLILFIATSIIASCGNSDTEVLKNNVDLKNDPQKNIFVSECIKSANLVYPQSGDIYDRQCNCIWNKTLKSMNTAEIEAMRRDWSQPSDMPYMSTFIAETVKNTTQCAF